MQSLSPAVDWHESLSLSLSVCSLINCLCLSLFKYDETRPWHNNASSLQTTGRNKKHGLLISNLGLGEQGLHTVEKGHHLCMTRTQQGPFALLQPRFSFVFHVMYFFSTSALCALRFWVFSCKAEKRHLWFFSPPQVTFILVLHMLTKAPSDSRLTAECMQVLNWTTLASRFYSLLSN